MKVGTFILFAAMAAFFLVLPGCGPDKQEQHPAEVKSIEYPPEVTTIKGTVLEVIYDGKFMYLLLDRGEKQTWAAAPAVDVEIGEDVSLLLANVFQKFYSKSLQRSFDELIFSAGIEGKKPRQRSGIAKQAQTESPR